MHKFSLKLIFSIVCFSLGQSLYSQENQAVNQVKYGLILGKVITDNGLPIVNAKIEVSVSTENTYTDVDGNYSLKLPEGKVYIQVSFNGFITDGDSAMIESGKNTYANFVLSKMERIQETEVKAKKKPTAGSVSQAVKTKELSTQVVEAISAEDFAKTTIRTTSDALKRIPGATITEGKFANIRGMFDRYNAGYLNGAPLPSTESDRKAFSFDVIPAGLLDGIVVIKSGTPDLIGDFGGGIIKINTKSIPEKRIQSFSIGFQYNDITTGRDIRAFGVGNSEFLGLISKENQIPELDPRMKVDYVNAPVNVNETKKFASDWKLKNISALPSPRLSYTFGLPFKIKKMQAGLMFSWNYSMTQKFSFGNIDSRDYSDNRAIREFDDSTFSTNVQNGGVLNFALKINNRNKIDFKNLISHTFDANSILRSGTASIDDGLGTNGYSNITNLNQLYSSQLIGSHSIGEKQSSINWVLNYGYTNRQVPDFRIAQYGFDITDTANTRMLLKNEFFRDGSGRFFSSLEENSYSAAVDFNTDLGGKKFNWLLKTGLYAQYRNRNFTSRQFIYGPIFEPIFSVNSPEQDLKFENIKEDGLYLIEKTRDKDDYSAFSRLQAAYAMFENQYNMLPIWNLISRNKKVKTKSLRIMYGARAEIFKQQLENKTFRQMGKYLADPDQTLHILPSINMNVPLTQKSNLRLAYYKTVNRPELRELAPFAFYNFSINSEILGFVDLKTADISNMDIRWEVYSNKEDMLSIGLFRKKIINPIEFNLDPTQVQIRTFTYQNQNIANNQGLEIEIRKNLAQIGTLVGGRFWKNLTFYGNYALIKSEVEYTDRDEVKIRPLQGQSPYVINLSLFYENKNGWQCNASYNQIGQRIAFIGLPSDRGKFGVDIYEFGRSILDFQVAKKIGKGGLFKVTMGDLLAQKSVFYQDMNKNGRYDTPAAIDGGDNTLISFTNGRTITAGYTLNF